ncbi:MAG TPA: prolyl oligopeptidase family serine peptidase [Roseiflexaceae bacterium]|nr:prolyl oligopeptidase family serine peptidase [Roseiflexaceae bacterium]
MNRPSKIRNLGLLTGLIALCACGPLGAQPAPTAVPTVAVAAATLAPTSAPSPTAEPTAMPEPSATATAAPSATAAPTPTAAPTATPDPVAGLTIPDLRARSYGAGDITIGGVYINGPNYTTYRISYPAGDLRLTGLLHVPDGDGPFPVIIANRGTIARDRYQPGMDSRAFADFMVRRGYLVVAPDFRGYAGGDDGPNPFYTGYYQDVLYLIPLAQKLSMARPGKVGMWGHSRGASATVAALTISDQIAAAVVYAPAPADLAADYARRRRATGGNPGSDTWPFPPNENPAAYARVSPINYFDRVSAPVMLHHGTADVTVDSSASVAIADALRAAGKDVTLHLYEGGPHTLTGAQERQYFQRTLDFFQTHLGTPSQP